jgi:hypothetical protein
MDLETLFWLLLISIPILRRLFGGNKNKSSKTAPKKPRPRPQKRPAQSPRQASGDGARVEQRKQLSPFQEALQQIQDALAEAREQQANQQAEAEKAKREAREPRIEVREATFASSPREKEKPAAKPEKKEKKGFFESKTLEHFTPPPPPQQVQSTAPVHKSTFYDDDFESEAPYEEEFHETVHSHLSSGDDDDLPARKKKVDRSKWQQAYVMHEILRRPRSVRPWTAPKPGKDD